MRFSCSVLGWIESYLTGQSQAVYNRFSGAVSAFAPLKVGVPQGSVLGPLLFSLYLMDFKDILHHCKYNFYADDLHVYLHCAPRDVPETIRKLNKDIVSISRWADSNKLLLNAQKTQAMIAGTSRYLNAIDHGLLLDIVVDGEVIRLLPHVKYLGVTIANNLSWEVHVTNVTKKIRTVLYQLKLCGHLIPQSLKSRLMSTLIFPHVDYCCTALTDITADLGLKLYRAINACLKFIYDVKRDQHITPYYKKSSWLKVTTRRQYFVGCLIRNIIVTHQPYTLYSSLVFRAERIGRITRAESNSLIIPQCRTELFKRSFRFVASKFWNGLPMRIRDARTAAEFKRRLYDFLLSGTYITFLTAVISQSTSICLHI